MISNLKGEKMRGQAHDEVPEDGDDEDGDAAKEPDEHAVGRQQSELCHPKM